MIAVVYRSEDAGQLVRELAAQVARFSGKRVLIVDGPRRAGDPRLFATGHDAPDLAAWSELVSRMPWLQEV